ncbi:ATP-binding protein [Virgibacillus sp. YIM 98842]|uniref:sensor histidine kinase n=1 Tax=Virgibacillus sp. YIM 98842 TaxID=2663533 RepID=UPI001F0890D9|nr:ATP-binding protein [Virgibacillus sp. YIM 98842]
MLLNNNNRTSLLPKRFLFRLTFINVIVIASFIALSSWAIYNTACMLHDNLTAVSSQSQFESTLFQYLWIFSISAIVVGSMIHFYLTKKLLHPLRELIASTKIIKRGEYPKPIKIESEDEIGQLIGHFNDLVSQLKANEAHRHKLVSDLSHEFRTPLSNLNGYLSALSKGVIEGDKELYQSLHNESERLVKLVEQMEQLKEWDFVSKQNFSEKETVDMQRLTNQCVQMFQRTLKEQGIITEVHVESGLINTNNGGISQVISNLLDNAIRYYEGEDPIKITGRAMNTEYLFRIAGPGKSIPVAEQDRIFERFYRIDPSRSKESGGSGLGLAISKEIIEHHNGKIGITSDGNHHTFWFTLPILGEYSSSHMG